MSDYRWCGRKGSVGCCTGHDEEYHAMGDELATLRAALSEAEGKRGEALALSESRRRNNETLRTRNKRLRALMVSWRGRIRDRAAEAYNARERSRALTAERDAAEEKAAAGLKALAGAVENAQKERARAEAAEKERDAAREDAERLAGVLRWLHDEQNTERHEPSRKCTCEANYALAAHEAAKGRR